MAVTTDTPKKRGRPSEGAREAVLAAARQLFIKRDYGEVSTADVLEQAGVSRGALYHHFPSKRDLYREVWRDSERRLIERLAASAEGAETPFEALVAGCRAYLDESASNREVQRIGLLQSRTVLGWEGWREGIRDLGLATMRGAIEAAMDSGELQRADPETAAHLLLAALIEAGLLIATSADSEATRAEAERPLMEMLEGLRA
jgi:AcrR family transcriptional regulator